MHPLLNPDAAHGDELEQRLDAFEEAWQSGRHPAIESFLSSADDASSSAPFLEELIKIDLEYRWRQATRGKAADAPGWGRTTVPARARVEHYLDQFPALDRGDGPALALIAEEYRVRWRWGDCPQVHEYLARFPGRDAEISAALTQVSHELESEWPADGARKPDAPTHAAPPAESLPTVAGHHLIAVLGRGGMGVVYKARQARLNRLVALKMIVGGSHAGPGERARFRIEAEAAARLQHPNIVQIFEVGEAETQPFVVLELVEGGTLAQRLAREPLAPRQAAALVATLARAIHAAHQRGIIHRDLKPANILLATDGPQEPDPASLGVPKISDFGLAKQLDLTALEPGAPPPNVPTQTGAILGTPSYMAPEQAAGRSAAIGPSADIYALGAILYEALVGRPPFHGPTVLDTLEQVRSQPPVPPSRLQPKVPRDIETICLKCLSKEPHHRYTSAEALADDLGRFLEGVPVEARPIPTWTRTARWARRRPTIASLGAFSILAAVAVIVVGLVTNVRLRAAARLAAARQAQAEASFQTAFEAVDRMLSHVGGERLGEVPEMEEVRREILADALEFLQSFLKERGGADLVVRRELGIAYQRMARIESMLGRTDRAIHAERQALAVHARVVAEFPARVDDRYQLARAHDELGLLLFGPSAHRAEAESHFRSAIALCEPIAARAPHSRTRLASCYQNLANHLADRGQDDQAEGYFLKSVALCEELVRDHATDAESELARSLYNLGLFHHTRGRTDQARRAFLRCARLWESIARDQPGFRKRQSDLAECYTSLGHLETAAGKFEEAGLVLSKAVALREQLARVYPNSPSYQDDLARAFHNLGESDFIHGLRPESEAAYLKAVAIREPLVARHPDHTRLKIALAETYQNLGLVVAGLNRPEDARATYIKALTILDDLTRAQWEKARVADALGSVCINLANLLRESGKPDEAMPHHDRSVQLLEQLRRERATEVHLRNQLVNAYGSRALTESSTGRHQDAARDWEKLIALARPEVGDRYRLLFALTLARAGDHARAVDEAQRAQSKAGSSGDDDYNWACVYALALGAVSSDSRLTPEQRNILPHQYEEGAVGALHRAARHGLFQQEEGAKLLDQDPDLAALRACLGFPALAAELRRIKAGD